VITRPGTDKQRRLPPIVPTPHGGRAAG
jgi:hypothetical protein